MYVNKYVCMYVYICNLRYLNANLATVMIHTLRSLHNNAFYIRTVSIQCLWEQECYSIVNSSPWDYMTHSGDR